MSILARLFGGKPRAAAPAPEPPVPSRTEPAVAASPTPEQSVELVLRDLEKRLKTFPDRSLPIVSLRMSDEIGRPSILWHYATGPGRSLDTEAAERVLSRALGPRGFKLSNAGSMLDRHDNAYQMWDYIKLTGDPHEKQIEQLDALGRESAVAKAQQLLADGQIELLTAWLHSGNYYGIPAEVLKESNRDEAAQAIIPLLKDSGSEVRTRAAAALGPLGGVEAAKALCAALPGAANRAEYWSLAGAIERLAWPGAASALRQAIANSHHSSVRAALAKALVRCGDVQNGLDILYAGLADGAGSNEYASVLATLDKDGIRDARLVSEVMALMDRTESRTSTDIAIDVITRHKNQWEEARNATRPTYIRATPTRRYQGEVICPIDKASAITGIPVDDLHRLIRARRVDGGYLGPPAGYWFVRLDGNVPCGELLDDPEPQRRVIGAKQEALGGEG